MLVKKEIVNALVKIILDNKCKTKVEGLFCNKAYFFTYDVKITKPGKFPDPGIFYIDNFQIGTSVAVEKRLQSWNFKLKEVIKIIYGYFFKPVGLNQIQDI